MHNGLNKGEQRRIQKCIASRVYDLCPNAKEQPKYFRAIYHSIKQRFSVSSYKEIHRNQIFAAIRYVENWKPTAHSLSENRGVKYASNK
ncbi:ORF6C domain-containing protein [Bacillus niameyensis]|uniref:ORF6C domain-containing protein n=1 Tax=Bacillus niameyensis TaxID=1522308 RepID=UPI000781261B|nr:ORF6C domain-containing protein [Bacillus niameyensis]